MDRHGLSRLCYLCSITTITLGLSFEGIFMMLLLEQYLHEKSLETSRCVTFRLSLVAPREKCVVCEKSRSPVFPCYEHRVFYVLNSAPPRKRRTSNRTISSSGSSSSTSPPPPLRIQLPVFAVGPTEGRNKRTKLAVGTASAGNGNQNASALYAASAAPRETPSAATLSRARVQRAIRREFMSAEERALHDTRKRIAAYLNVSRKHVLGPVFLYESHYTWTRLNDMRDRERDRANYHPNCAKVECNAEYELNEAAIERYLHNYMPKPLLVEPFACFAGESADVKGEHAAFMKHTLNDALVFHMLLWPLVWSIVGFLALIFNLTFMGCDVWHD